MYLKNSQARRDLPIPAIPVTCTRWARPVLGTGVEELLDQPQLAVPADERRLQALRLMQAAPSGNDTQRPVERDRLGLALELIGAGVLISDRRLGGSLGCLPDQHRPGLGADWIRDAVFTRSPATIPWPLAPRLTAASTAEHASPRG